MEEVLGDIEGGGEWAGFKNYGRKDKKVMERV